MPFQAFIDESGTGPKDGPIFMLSGYVSPDYWWEDFCGEWQVMLDTPPRICYFKMQEAARRDGQFNRVTMSAVARDAKVTKAIELVKLVAQASLSCVVPFALYVQVVQGKIPHDFDYPAFLAMFDVMTKAVENQLAADGDPVNFYFDNHVKWRDVVPRWYDLWRQLSPLQYGAMMGATPRFEDDKVCLPLQTADLQSWYFRRLFAERVCGDPFPPGLPKEMFNPLDHIPSLMSIWDKSRLENLAAGRAQLSADTWPRRYATIHDLL